MSEVMTFEPIPMERVWGGRRLESLLNKNLPPGAPFGESWEVVDREDAQSVVHTGEFRGRTLHELWRDHREAVFGAAFTNYPSERFPILIKLLDARERLSVQVHPPTHAAAALSGEPKTEVWYFLDCQAGASIYAGLKRGVTRPQFEDAVRQGRVEELIHRLPVAAGESIFIPSGRLHAIGEGCLIVEVQQNSDTTYRVFDWNRDGLDGKPRQLHIEESLASIDFEDFEPRLTDSSSGVVAACEHFAVERWDLDGEREAINGGAFAIFVVIEGQVGCGDNVFERGEFFLVPATLGGTRLRPVGGVAAVLRTTLPLPRRGRGEFRPESA